MIMETHFCHFTKSSKLISYAFAAAAAAAVAAILYCCRHSSAQDPFQS